MAAPAPAALPGTARERFLAEFATLERAGAAMGPSWLRAARFAARDRFRELGFPTVRDEEWRYTSVAPIAEMPFRVAGDGGFDGLRPEALASFGLGEAHWSRLVFVDGRHAAKLSSGAALAGSVRAGSLAEALVTAPALLEPHLGAPAAGDHDAFAALNMAFVRDGAFIHLPPGLTAPAPIHLLFVTTDAEGAVPPAVHPRNLIVAERGSRVTVVESHVSLGVGTHLTNTVTEVVAGEGARVEHYTIQRESAAAFHVGTLRIAQARDSAVSAYSIALGGRLVRNNVDVAFRGEGADCTLHGLYVMAGRQHVDNRITVDHAVPRCSSRQLYKGVLDGQAKAVFHGKILVRRDAQKTDAHQTNKNLVLSDGVEVASKPWLEIFADDVKCTHGAAEGQLAEESIFYLKSRGLSDETARALLTYGFANEVIDRIPIESIRTHLDGLLQARLWGARRET